MHVKPVLLALSLVLAATLSASSQVAPSAREGGLPLVVGAGFSNFNIDWTDPVTHGTDRLSGATAWVDWNFYRAPRILQGLGIEVEGRDLNYGQPSGEANLRMDTIAGGPLYTWRHYRGFHPYAKVLGGYGSIDFTIPLSPNYKHDTRTFYAPGGGVEFKAWRGVWVRGEYEYQFWNNFFQHKTQTPNGFTIGATYDLRTLMRRQ